MTEYFFSLIPFLNLGPPDIQITGKTSRENNILSIEYSLAGDCKNILFPEVSLQPLRRAELWKESCFEFFLAIPNQPQYWEFNMSPSGDWNIYYMDAYRRVGFREETLFQGLQFSAQRAPGGVIVNATVDLLPILPSEIPAQLGITSVIQTRDGHETYWALAHPNPQADFHLRDSFIIQL